jgi:hypothetical protein
MPWWWVAVALLVLAAVFLAGFYVGREDEPARESQGKGTSAEAQGEAGKGNRKARRERRVACRTALDLSLQLIDLQRGALAEETQLAAAVAAEDVGRIDALRESLEAITAQASGVQAQLDQAVATCRP